MVASVGRLCTFDHRCTAFYFNGTRVYHHSFDSFVCCFMAFNVWNLNRSNYSKRTHAIISIKERKKTLLCLCCSLFTSSQRNSLVGFFLLIQEIHFLVCFFSSLQYYEYVSLYWIWKRKDLLLHERTVSIIGRLKNGLVAVRARNMCAPHINRVLCIKRSMQSSNLLDNE